MRIFFFHLFSFPLLFFFLVLRFEIKDSVKRGNFVKLFNKRKREGKRGFLKKPVSSDLYPTRFNRFNIHKALWMLLRMHGGEIHEGTVGAPGTLQDNAKPFGLQDNDHVSLRIHSCQYVSMQMRPTGRVDNNPLTPSLPFLTPN